MTAGPITLARRLVRWLLARGTVLLYAGSNVALQAVTLVAQFIVLKYVPPAQMGIWGTVLLLQGYLLISQLGILNAMNREYPYALGKKDMETARTIAQTGQFYSLANGLLLAVVLGALALFRSGEWRWTYLTMAAITAIQQYTSYLEGTYRASHEFRTLAWLRLAQVPLQVVTVAIPWLWGFNGYLWRVLVLAVIPLAMCHAWRPLRVGPCFHWGQFRRMFAVGWRLYVWNYVVKFALSLPRLSLALLGGVLLLGWFKPLAGADEKQAAANATLLLGLFTPVMWMSVAVSGFTGSLTSYLYPTLTYRYARDGTAPGKAAMRASLLCVAFLAPPVALGCLALPWLLPAVAPKYAPAVVATQLALVASLLECMSIATLSFAVTKAWKSMFAYLAGSVVIRAAGAFGGYWAVTDRLVGVAGGMLVSSIGMAVLTWFTVPRGIARAAAPVQNEDVT